MEEHTFRGDYTVLGNDFHIEFDWAVHGGQVALTYVGVDENYRIPANPGMEISPTDQTEQQK